MTNNDIRRGIIRFVTESTEPLKNTVSRVLCFRETPETNANIALSKDIPKTNVVSIKTRTCKFQVCLGILVPRNSLTIAHGAKSELTGKEEPKGYFGLGLSLDLAKSILDIGDYILGIFYSP